MDGSHEVEVTVIDNTGLVVGLATTVPPGVDVAPRDGDPPGPRVVNVPADDRLLVVGWELLYCDTDATLSLDRFDGQTVVTFDPGGPSDCDLVGGRYALVLALSQPVPARSVITRNAASPPEDAIMLGQRLEASDRGQDYIAVIDRTHLSIGAAADEPPVLAPGSTGIAVVNAPGQDRALSVAWSAPCGTESTLVIEQVGPRIAFRVEVLDVDLCPGESVYGLTLTFVRPVSTSEVVPTVVNVTP